MLSHKIDDEVSLRLFNEDDAEEFYHLTIDSKTYLKKWLGWLDYIESVEDTAQNIRARLKGFVEMVAIQSHLQSCIKGKSLAL